MTTLNTQVKGVQIKEAFAGDCVTITSGIIAVDSNMENLSPLCDGSETGFWLAYTPQNASLQVYLNGLFQESGAGKDYTLSNSTVTFETAPANNDVLLFYYLISGAGAIDPRGRGVFGGGTTGSTNNTIDYVTISSAANAANFGDLTIAWSNLAATSNGTTDRGIFGGGVGLINTINYITISSVGNATDFGDLTVGREYLSSTSNGTTDRGIFGGGNTGGSTEVNIVDYVTISSTGNATNFGDLTVARDNITATSNGTNDRGVFAGGWSTITENTIDYVTISSAANATDFGDLTVARINIAASSNSTNERGIFGGGNVSGNVIDYVTISSTSDATDFGDLTAVRHSLAATSNGTTDRGIFGGGYTPTSNTIDYVTISSTSNATNFGDLTVARYRLAATSNA